MTYPHLKLDKNGMELGTRGTWAYPVSDHVGSIRIDSYEGARFECHFHAETELTFFTEGRMYYRANDQVFLMRAGDAIFVNSNVMHAGWQYEAEPAVYQPVNFSTVMVSGHSASRIEQEYVEPILRDQLLPFLVLRYDRAEDAPLLALCYELRDRIAAGGEGHELLVKSLLCRIWYEFYRLAHARTDIAPDHGAEKVKRAIGYMEAHYAEELTLADLAASCGLSRSEFCRTFRKYTGRTPFTYLQHLRVRRSLPLLAERELPITEVAARTGFSGASYYAEIFRRFMALSPLEYRKRRIG